MHIMDPIDIFCDIVTFAMLCNIDGLSSSLDRKCQTPANNIEGAHSLTDVVLNTAGRTCLKSLDSTSNVGNKSEAKSEIFIEYLATVCCIVCRIVVAAPAWTGLSCARVKRGHAAAS